MTAPLKPIESPDGLAGQSLGAAPCSAKITQRQLESILINEGIIQAAAIEDPDGYDGGRTELAITIATQQINELISRNASTGPTALLGLLADIRAAVGDPSGKLMQDELVEHCRHMRTALETISMYYRGDERIAESVLEMRRIAKRALWPNDAHKPSGENPR